MMFRFRPEIERILSGISRGEIDGGIWKWQSRFQRDRSGLAEEKKERFA